MRFPVPVDDLAMDHLSATLLEIQGNTSVEDLLGNTSVEDLLGNASVEYLAFVQGYAPARPRAPPDALYGHRLRIQLGQVPPSA
jgi:hypothetical protein